MGTHHTEQAARGYLMYRLALRGYTVQFTDSRFPKEDLLVVSENGAHFGIDVKGQRTSSFWQFSYKQPSAQLFIAFVFVPPTAAPRCFIVPSTAAMEMWEQYKKAATQRSVSHARWGINWSTPLPYEETGWNLLPP
jgi:hypothetical protein